MIRGGGGRGGRAGFSQICGHFKHPQMQIGDGTERTIHGPLACVGGRGGGRGESWGKGKQQVHTHTQPVPVGSWRGWTVFVADDGMENVPLQHLACSGTVLKPFSPVGWGQAGSVGYGRRGRVLRHTRQRLTSDLEALQRLKEEMAKMRTPDG
jgi:hypothetical protein